MSMAAVSLLTADAATLCDAQDRRPEGLHTSNCKNDRPLFNTKSSFFRDNSPFFLHFQQIKSGGKLAFMLQFAVRSYTKSRRRTRACLAAR